MFASCFGHMKVLELLMSSGADVSTKNKVRQTLQ